MMKINKGLVVMGLSGFLLACGNNTSSSNQSNNKTQITQKNQESTFHLDQNIHQLTAHTWQFEKGENLTQAWLIKMDKRATLGFYRHTQEPNDLIAPTPNDRVVFLGVSSYAGCASLNGVIGLDKTQATIHATDVGFFGDAPYCGDTTQMENALMTFIGGGDVNYEFIDGHLILRDGDNQTLFFKKQSR